MGQPAAELQRFNHVQFRRDLDAGASWIRQEVDFNHSPASMDAHCPSLSNFSKIEECVAKLLMI